MVYPLPDLRLKLTLCQPDGVSPLPDIKDVAPHNIIISTSYYHNIHPVPTWWYLPLLWCQGCCSSCLSTPPPHPPPRRRHPEQKIFLDPCTKIIFLTPWTKKIFLAPWTKKNIFGTLNKNIFETPQSYELQLRETWHIIAVLGIKYFVAELDVIELPSRAKTE